MSDTDEKEGGIVDFVEMYGGSDSDDADGGDGDEFFTFGGGVIDVDEIFGGIDENLILDGGGNLPRDNKDRDTQQNTSPPAETVEQPESIITTDEVSGEESGEESKNPITEKQSGSIITTGEVSGGKSKNPITEKQPETKKEDKQKEPEEKFENPIKATDNESEDGGSVHSFHMGVDGGGGGESVCATIVKLLPDLFDPIHDK